MSIFGGDAKTKATTPTKALGIDFQGAQYGPPISVVFGQNRTSGNCIWYGDFQAIAQKQQQGGKGGGGGSTTSYTYSASFELGLCEGVASIVNVYQGSSTVSLSTAGGVAFSGAAGQAPWAHLSGNAALGYSGTSLVAFQNYQLGSSASLPNFNFEVAGRNQVGGGIVDALPSDIMTAICTDAQVGVNFNALGDLTQFKNYCGAAGLFFSPVYATQQSASQTLDDLLKYANSAAWFSEGVLKVAPYGDQNLSGNGYTYTANVTPVVNLGASDFITNGSGDPVSIERKGPADALNIRRVEFKDRANTYHDSAVVASIDQDVVNTGSRADTSDSVDMITSAPVARMVAQNLLQRTYYIRNTYTFQLSWRYCYLEPMDIVTLTDANTGLSAWPVRITEVSEDEHGLLSITAEEFPEGIGHAAIYGTQANGATAVDPNHDPGPITAPYLFRGPGFLVSNTEPEVWCALAASDPLWGGCNVYLSHDGNSYTYLCTTTRQANYGELTSSLPSAADPDTGNAPNVILNANGQLLGGTQADADNFVTLAMVDTEVISYETATLEAGPSYTLGYLRRGGYGSAIASHSANAPFVRLDENILRIPVDPSQIGQTVYLKFLSLNVFGVTPRTLAEETAYQYVIGSNMELPDVPATPASVLVFGVADGVAITWQNPNPAAVGCTSIEYATASGGPWAVLAQVGPTTTAYAHHFTTATTYYYRLRARGALISGGWSAYSAVNNGTGNSVAAIQAEVTTVGNEAAAAQASANQANAQLANIASDGILSPAEKPTVERDYTVITTEQAGIDAQAVAFLGSGSSQQTAYDNAISSLTSYLNGLTSPTAWNDKSGNTTVVGTTFRSKFNSVYTARQTLLNAVYAQAQTLANNAQTTANTAQTTANTALTSVVVQNANFTNGLFGWTLTPSSDFYQENGTNNPNPNISTYLVHKGVSGETYANAVSTTGAPVVPGQTVTAIMCLEEFSANSTATANAAIFWYTNSGSYIGESASTMTCGVSGTATRLNSKVIAQAPSNAAFAMVGAEWHNHTSGYINATTASLTLQPSSVDDVPDGSIYLRQTLVNGTAISIPNSTWQMPLDASGNIPGWFTKSGTSGLSTSVVKFGKQSIILSSTSSSPGVLQCRTQYKVIPGDYIAIEGWANAVSGTKCCLAANFIDANGNYLGDIEAQVTTGAWTQAQAGGVVPSNAAAMYLQAYLYEPSSGTAYAYFNEVDVKINDLRTAGSGAQMGDLRNLKQRSVTNVPAKVPTTISYSANAGSPATATISIAAFTVLAGSVSVSYNAMSVSTTGTNGANVTYYLYFDDPTYAGGTHTLVATTNGNDCYASDARVYVGSIAVAYPTSGGGSGGGGGGGMCVCAHMWLDEDTQARECKRGYIADCLDLPSSGLRKFRRRLLGMEMDISPCVRITTAGGAVLECSITTPFDLLDGRTVRAPAMDGEQVVTDWGIERVTSVIDIGEQLVCHQHYGGCSYAAGVDPGHRIYSHNTFEKP